MSADPGQWFVLGWLCGAICVAWLRRSRKHRHSWSGWTENLGRYARFRTCDCGAIEIEGKGTGGLDW